MTPRYTRHDQRLVCKGRVTKHTGSLDGLDRPVTVAHEFLEGVEQYWVEVMPSPMLRQVLRMAAIAGWASIGMQVPRDSACLDSVPVGVQPWWSQDRNAAEAAHTFADCRADRIGGEPSTLCLPHEWPPRHDPHERLHIDQVSGSERVEPLQKSIAEDQQPVVGVPLRARGIRQIEREGFSDPLSLHRLERNMWRSGFARNGRIVTTGQVSTRALPGSAGRLPVASTSPENAGSSPSSTSLRTAEPNVCAARWVSTESLVQSDELLRRQQVREDLSAL